MIKCYSCKKKVDAENFHQQYNYCPECGLFLFKQKGETVKRFYFYFLKKPSFHIHKFNDGVEVSIGWLNFIFVKKQKEV